MALNLQYSLPVLNSYDFLIRFQFLSDESAAAGTRLHLVVDVIVLYSCIVEVAESGVCVVSTVGLWDTKLVV